MKRIKKIFQFLIALGIVIVLFWGSIELTKTLTTGQCILISVFALVIMQHISRNKTPARYSKTWKYDSDGNLIGVEETQS